MGPSEKEPCEITAEEELQPEQHDLAVTSPDKLAMSKDIKDRLEWGRFSIGSKTLGWCIFLMVLCIFLSLLKPDNELIKNGFEAFKLIVMTLLGYMFGSKSSN